MLIAVASLAACSVANPQARIAASPPAILLPVSLAGITDGRGRFREIYCAVRDDHGYRLAFDRPCDDGTALWRLSGEPPASGARVSVGVSAAGLTVVMVPGLLAECASGMSTVFADARANLETQGYRTAYIQTRGRQSSEVNALIIRDAVRAMPETSRTILVTHSKGTVDALIALTAYPDLMDHVVALVSVAGAVNGSPLADSLPNWLAELAEETSLADCAPGEGVEAFDSLRRSVRLAWLSEHPTPARLRSYSLPAIAGPEDISAVLQPFYRTLAETDPANDGLVAASDAIIPGSTLLGYANADHLAVAMPFGADTPVLAATLITRNDYPRAVLLEAAIRYVEEDLRKSATRRSPAP